MKKTSFRLGPRAAIAVFPPLQAPASAIKEALHLPPYQAVGMVVGAAGSLDPALRPALAPLFETIVRVAHEASAVLLSGGTRAGVMALLGEAADRQLYTSAVVGVAPAALVHYPGGAAHAAPLEPHHSHFVLVEGQNWGDETATLFGVATELANTPAGRRPAVVLLAGGGGIARNEIVQATRHRLPVLVISGTGGLADELAAAWPQRQTPPSESRLAEILTTGNLRFFPLDGTPAALAQELRQLLGVPLR